MEERVTEPAEEAARTDAPGAATGVAAAPARAVLEMRDVRKRFGSTQALDGVSMALYPGEIHALLGENGAGKSTLIKIMTGVNQPDTGEMLIDGEPVRVASSQDGQRLGVAAIYQEPMIFPDLSVAENIFIGHRKRSRIVRRKRMREEAEEVLARLGVNLDVGAPARGLTLAEQQTVEIAKAISLDVRVLIMDEPTASLSAHEVQQLFRIVGTLKAAGVAVLFISHRMEEVFEISDRVTIRYARSIDSGATFGTSRALSPADRSVTRPVVAHGPKGVVGVLWEDADDGRIRVRISKDHGATFGPIREIGFSGADLESEMGIGTGVIHVAYVAGSQLRLRRSLDGGATWKPHVVLSRRVARFPISIAVDGTMAVVGYTERYAVTGFDRVRYRRTEDRGSTWTAARSVAVDTWYTNSLHVALHDGTLHAAFSRCFQDAELCVQPRVQYRSSTDGVSWSAAARVSPDGTYEAIADGIAVAGSILVTYTSYIPDGVVVRSRS
jgi:ABC-type branched-subunit amino acid transport system ATPase component